MAVELFLVHGKPGSGKSTASKLAAEQLENVYNFSIGEELRARALHDKPSRHSDELKQYAEQLRQALPVPSHLPGLVFEECIESSPHQTVIVDGYPQYADRLPGFTETIERVGGKVLAICLIEVSDETAAERIAGRARRTTLVAEDEVYITKRLDGYRKNALPTIEAMSQDYLVHVINGEADQQEVSNELATFISNR
ncbi:MAG: nucleoside monophosphate kinase [Patescibacteria group bacterium]|nr:nucleoside monophosphate kinase [Patescibacteria group bacterium]